MSCTVNRRGFAHGGVKFHKAETLNIFTRATANPMNCCGLLRDAILFKNYNSSQDLQCKALCKATPIDGNCLLYISENLEKISIVL
jgi:hypothetical protein